ncbi:inosine/xanthosine triphosphatase [Maribellus mangrovi]|uniref:inosine/xanthosine triphosphatase n=1 Tax=Maribellus mangrovi TaxID=3133146 RepID=UPI0030ED72D9
MKVCVASANPVKINATKSGFETYFSDVDVQGMTVDSGVSDQPMSDTETLEGARNRAAKIRKLFPAADYWVGIEGGVERDYKNLSAFAWIVVLSRNGKGESRTTTFYLPPQVSELIDSGYELGTANDWIFKKHNSKQKSGAVGLLTQDKLTRTELYTQAVQLALIPIINREMYRPTAR